MSTLHNWWSRTLLIGLGLSFGLITAVLWAHPDDPKGKDRLPVYDGPGFKRALARPGEQPRVVPIVQQPRQPDERPIDAAGEAQARDLAGLTFAAVGLRLQSWITIPAFDATFDAANDIWGYTSPGGREYAIIGLSDGTGFVDVTDPGNATIVDVLPGPNSIWRDMKTYGEYCYIVSEGGGGIQVFDLSQIDSGVITELIAVTDPGVVSTHNVALDPDGGTLYRCGGGSNYGLRMYDLSDPAAPAIAGEWHDRYVHDAQIVTMTSGPWAGRQIGFLCGGFNGGHVEPGLDIVDLTDEASPINLSRIEYVGGQYSHQAWLSDDRQYLFLNDELDEDNALPTIIHVIDVSDLEDPVPVGRFAANSTSIGHNLFTRDGLLYAANYRSGLRVFDVSDPVNASEVAYFDTFPSDDNANFNSLWGVYPYLPSGTIVGSDMEKGLFVWTLEAIVRFPGGVPERFDAAGTVVAVEFDESNGTIDASTATIVYDLGAGPQSEPLVSQEGGAGNVYEAALPSLPCGSVVSWYVTAMTTDGELVQHPTTAPALQHTSVVARSTPSLLFDDAESDQGWTAEVNLATSGGWERGVPVNDESWEYDVDTASGGAGSAWLTQNAAGNTDVDNGSVRLVSPELDLTYGEVVIAYDYFLRTNQPEAGADRIYVEVTEDDSSDVWVEIASHEADTGYRWLRGTIDQQTIEAAGVNMSPTMRVRFVAIDGGTQTIVEAGLDNILIGQANCCAGDCAGGPLAGDGVIDVLDLLAVLGAWGAAGTDCDPAPESGDGVIDVQDLLFVLSHWGPCE